MLCLNNKFTAGSHQLYWMIAFKEEAEALLDQAIGSVKIEHEDENAIVVAKAICLPILCHELSKGVMELISLHQFSNWNASKIGRVVRAADKATDETRLIQVGPDLWRKILKVVNAMKDKPSLPELATAFAVRPTKQVHDTIMAILDGKSEAQDMIRELVAGQQEESDYD